MTRLLIARGIARRVNIIVLSLFRSVSFLVGIPLFPVAAL